MAVSTLVGTASWLNMEKEVTPGPGIKIRQPVRVTPFMRPELRSHLSERMRRPPLAVHIATIATPACNTGVTTCITIPPGGCLVS